MSFKAICGLQTFGEENAKGSVGFEGTSNKNVIDMIIKKYLIKSLPLNVIKIFLFLSSFRTKILD